MKWRQLPPVGEFVSDVLSRREVFPGLPPEQILWVDSGTTALAIALQLAAVRSGRSGGEVVLPGYGCPDLLSACLWAGLKPVLVDLVPDTPWLALAAVEEAVGPGTVAVIAVNFMGVREQVAPLKSLAHGAGAVLIEDSAQCFPEDPVALEADFTVVSFGKGKPVSTLGGGALLAREAWRDFPVLAATKPGSLGLSVQRLAYNMVISPLIYGALVRIPGLGIGATRYQPLEAVNAMDAVRRRWLPGNAASWCRANQARATQMASGLAPLRDRGVVDVAQLGDHARLLRYPLLLPSEAATARAEIRLLAQGLGASRLYRRVLPEIAGVPAESLRCHGRLDAARGFADRLITLPVHSAVGEGDTAEMLRVIEGVL